MPRIITTQQVTERSEQLVSVLLLLHASEGKRMNINSFKQAMRHIPSYKRLYTCLIKNKIITSTGNPKNGFVVQYVPSIYPNTEMTRRIIKCSARTGERAVIHKPVQKQLPPTLYDKREFKPNISTSPQDQLVAEITLMKEAFEKQFGAKVEILIEVTMTTTVQL